MVVLSKHGRNLLVKCGKEIVVLSGQTYLKGY